jgi:glycosyltransferase involved in cell wall biosynthesis
MYEGSPDGASAVGRILAEEAPDLVHQHALTPACSTLLAQECKRRGLPVVFTYHTPTATCQRGTLLAWGTDQCDGRLDVARCTACTLDGLGLGASLSRILSAAPARAVELLERADWRGGAWTALRMSSLMRRRHAALGRFFEDVDRFVVLAPWVGDVLRRNGVPESKLVASPHGVDSGARRSEYRRDESAPLRLVHLGRADRFKGTDLLIRVFQATPDADAILDIYGVVQGEGSGELMEQFRALAAGDQRIRFLPAVPNADVGAMLTKYEMVVVPSQLVETGPLVVLEAFAAGVPVLGSALGGIADKVQDGIDGLLVRPFDSHEAWSAALKRCAADPVLLQSLRAGVRPPRGSEAVGSDMHDLYRSLLESSGREAMSLTVTGPRLVG